MNSVGVVVSKRQSASDLPPPDNDRFLARCAALWNDKPDKYSSCGCRHTLTFDNPPSDSLPYSDEAAASLTDALPESPEKLISAASEPALTEDLALALLKRSDLPAQALDQLSKNGDLMKIRKVKIAVVEHPKTPRHISIPMVRHLFTFDLMHVALTPAVPADIKIAAEDALIHRLERLPQGERLSLAHRASGRVAAELLNDPEPRVIHAALENSRLTESAVAKALMRRNASPALVEAVCQDSKWSVLREVRIALLRNEATPLDRALEFAQSLPAVLVREILGDSQLAADVKERVLNVVKESGEERGTRT
jgi:hypothetical protein